MYKGMGFGGNNMQMQNLMRQAQKLQADMQNKLKQAEEELESTTFTHTVGGGLVEIEMTGSKKIVDLRIKPEAVDPDDVEMLQDLLIVGINDALAKANEMEKNLKGGVTGGLF